MWLWMVPLSTYGLGTGQDRTGQDHGHPARVGGERQHMPHHLARAVLFWGTDITPSCLKSCG